MKRYISIILAFALCFALAACAASGDSIPAEASDPASDDGDTDGASDPSGETQEPTDNILQDPTDAPVPTDEVTEPETSPSNPAETMPSGSEQITPTPANEATPSSDPDDSVATQQPETSAEPTDGLLYAFSSTDFDGNEVGPEIFSDYDLTMINIWATFDSDCTDELPTLGSISVEYSDKGVRIVGIVLDVVNYDGSISEAQVDYAKQIASQAGADYMHMLPSDSLGSAILDHIQYVPTTVFVDRSGSQVGEQYVGSKSHDEWCVIIDDYLNQAKQRSA